jgi:hypothetical protein
MELTKITNFDWPDTIDVANGYDTKEVPDVTRDNLEFLMGKYNEIIEYLMEREV